MIVMATHEEGAPLPAMCNKHTHTAPFPVPVIQPNSHLKYRFIHLKKKNLLLRKKKFILSVSFLLAISYINIKTSCLTRSAKGYILIFRLSYT